MRFDYKNRPQSSGREKCGTCNLPMLGIGEDDPRSWHASTFSLKIFCDCPEIKSAPVENTIFYNHGICPLFISQAIIRPGVNGAPGKMENKVIVMPGQGIDISILDLRREKP